MPNRGAVFGPGFARSGLLPGRQLKPALIVPVGNSDIRLREIDIRLLVR